MPGGLLCRFGEVQPPNVSLLRQCLQSYLKLRTANSRHMEPSRTFKCAVERVANFQKFCRCCSGPESSTGRTAFLRWPQRLLIPYCSLAFLYPAIFCEGKGILGMALTGRVRARE